MMHDEEGMYDPVPCPLNPDFNHEDHEERSTKSTKKRKWGQVSTFNK